MELPPFDGLVADDDGREEEDERGAAHRSQDYKVHLRPPGPQQRRHGLCHCERMDGE